MKRLLYTLTLLILLPGLQQNIAAQTRYTVVIDSLPMSKGKLPAYSVILPQANLDDVEKILKDVYKDYKAKATGNAKTEVFFDDAKISALSDNTIDVYVRLYNLSQDVKVDAFFDLGGIYLNPKTHPAQSATAQQMMSDFATRYERYRVEQELKAEQDKLSEREKELESLIKEKEKMAKSISASERDIEKVRQDISTNDMEQTRKRSEIETQKDVILKISNAVGDEKKVAEKTLKDLEKDLEKLEKEEEKMYKSIEDQQSSIDENMRNIDKNLMAQTEKRSEIEQQKATVQEVQTKLMAVPRVK